MKKNSLFLLFSLLFSLYANNLFAQKQHDKWCFGNFATLDFNSGSPVTAAASGMACAEGSSSIADSCTGALLFYSNGISVWDASNTVMPNGTGLLASTSSTQAAMIIPSVGNTPDQYYIFATFPDFTYSVVDMTLPGNGTVPAPLGDIVAGQKNILLSTGSSERVTACMHSNCRDIWVLEHGVGNNAFKAWLVTSTGVSAAPVVSNVGTTPLVPWGGMRLSHNGRKLVINHYSGTGNNIFLYDFDNTTGAVTNEVYVTAAPAVARQNPYSAEFSPDDNLLYLAYLGGLDQFQVSAPSTTQVQIVSNPGTLKVVQMGPDCKIYVGMGNATTSISVISNPNNPGVACSYSANVIPLGPGQTSVNGLPNILTWRTEACTPPPGITYSVTPCSFLVQFNDTNCSVKSRSWDFGDPASGGANTSTLQNPSHMFTAAGTYTVTVILNQGGCLIDTITFSVTVSSPITLSTTSTPTNCIASTGTATATPSGGTPGYTYSWAGGQTTQTATGLAAGTYTVAVTDINGCNQTATVTVNSSNAPTASIPSSSNVLCNGGTTGSATGSATGGTPGYTYSWSPSGGTNSTATGLGVGTYTLTVTDAGGCTSTQTVSITEPSAITASAASTPTGCASPTGTATVTPAGGTPGYTYSWTGGQTTQTATGLAAGNYTVTVTDLNGCTQTATVAVLNSNGPTATIPTSSNVLCNGGTTGSATGSATGGTPGYTYSWNTVPVQTTVTATGLGAGTYTVTVTDAAGCTSTQAITITEPTAIAVTATSTPTGCTTSVGTVTATPSGGTPGYTYSWTGGQTTATATALAAGTYTVTVTDLNGCTQTATTAVGTTGGPTANAGLDVTIMLGSSTTLTATGGGTYSWSPATGLSCTTCFNPVATPNVTTTYCVLVTDANGCTDSACVKIIVEIPCNTSLLSTVMPNAFSPNADGNNDKLCVPANTCIVDFVLKIYDRWGEKVFETESLSYCWDGTYKDKDLNTAVFVYYFQATLSTGDKFEQKGNISLIK